MKYFFHKPAYLFLIVVLVVASGIFLTQTPTVLAACNPTEPSVSNTLTSITPSSQTFTNPSSIFINASGHTAFKCIYDGVTYMGWRSTTLSWVITNGIGQTMVSDSWNSPTSWDNPVAAGAVNYDGTPYGFVNGFAGTTIDVSSWPAGNYTLTLTSESDVVPVGTVVSLNSTLTITRPSACALSSFACDPSNAVLTWVTTNCSSVKLDGNSVVPNGYTQGTVGGNYILKIDDGTEYPKHCPSPTLTSGWQENNSPILNQTVTPGQQVTVPFNFSNTGESGSVIKNIECTIESVSGIPNENVELSQECLPTTITAP